MKTNATRILDALGIRYELREYAVDPEHLDAEAVAAKIGMPAEQVFKTLLVQGDSRGSYFAVIPGNMELDLKALAKLTGNRRIELAPLKEVTNLTGYIRGGVTVMGAQKRFPGLSGRNRMAVRPDLRFRRGSRNADCARASRLYPRRKSDRGRDREMMRSRQI